VVPTAVFPNKKRGGGVQEKLNRGVTNVVMYEIITFNRLGETSRGLHSSTDGLGNAIELDLTPWSRFDREKAGGKKNVVERGRARKARGEKKYVNCVLVKGCF